MNKDHLIEAVELFKSGFNCSQSVLAAFCEEYGLPVETAFRIACPFGGGIGGSGRTCGALTGGLMVVGLKYGPASGSDTGAKNLAREKTRMLIDNFIKSHGSCECNDLVGFDRSRMTSSELKAKLQYFHMVCPEFLATVVSFLEEEL